MRTIKVKACTRNGHVVKAHTRTVGSSTAKKNVTELDKRLNNKHLGLSGKKVGDHLSSINGEDHHYAGYSNGKHYATDGLGRKKEILSSQSVGMTTRHKMRLVKKEKSKKDKQKDAVAYFKKHGGIDATFRKAGSVTKVITTKQMNKMKGKK